MAVAQTTSIEDVLSIVDEFGLSPAAVAYVKEALESEPSRTVGQYATKNVVGNYSSPSQGFTVQSESHGAELAFILRWEYDKAVLVYIDQPPPVQFYKTDVNGRRIPVTYTPDFLVVTRTRVLIVEVKREKQLLTNASKYPDQWITDGTNWAYKPAFDHFQTIGLEHVVCNATALSRVETSNLKALIRVAHSESSVSDEVRRGVQKTLSRSAWISLADLKDRLALNSYSPLLKMVHDQELHTDLTYAFLARPAAVIVSTSREVVEAAISSTQHTPGDSQVVVSTMRVPSRKAAIRALKNLERVRTKKGRHERRLRERIAEGAGAGLNAFQSLIWRYRGNTESRLPDAVEKYLVAHIRVDYKTKAFRSFSAAHADYRLSARKEHPTFEPVSRKTYISWKRKEDSEDVAESKGGKRAKNAASLPSEVTDREIVATRPFERGCIDHTLLKIFVIVVESNGRTYVRRPWLTSFVDAYSDYWLAFHLSFKAPSRQSLAMIFRNCVREYGRVPEFVHSDRGADLRSTFYQSLLAHIQCSPDWNPAANSRFNSQAELINLHVQDKWIAARPGNLIDYDNRRKYSKGYRPPDLAVLKLHQLFRELSEYRSIYNDTVIGVEEESPQILFNRGLEDFDFSGIPVEFDHDFVIASAVDTRQDEYKIQDNGDILRNGLHYSNPELRRIRPRKSHTEVRPDPEDPYKIYCKADGQWVTALSGRHNVFRRQTHFERWGEAVSVSECRPVRDYAKDHAHEVIAERVAELDTAIESSAASNVVEFPMASASPTTKKSAVFAQLRETEITELDSEDRE